MGTPSRLRVALMSESPHRCPAAALGLISLSSAPAALITSRNICTSPATHRKGQTAVNGHRGALRPSGRVAVHKFGKRELGRKCGSCHRTCEAGCFGSFSRVLDQIPNRDNLRRKGLYCCHVVWSSNPSQGGTWQQKLLTAETSGIRERGVPMFTRHSPLLTQSRTPAFGMVPSNPSWDGVFPPQINLSFSSKPYPEVCLLGDPKASHYCLLWVVRR